MNTRTTLHCQRIPSWAPAALSALGGGWVKIVNPSAGADPFPTLRKDIRIWSDDWDRECIARGAAGADDYMARMLPLWAPFRGWANVAFELPNEPPCNGNLELAALDVFTERCIAIANANGLRLIVLGLSEGNPSDNGTGDASVTRWKVQQLAGCVKAAVAGGHLVGLHGYWRPGVEGPTGRYHVLRCIDMVTWWGAAGVDVSRLRLALTEFGVDGGIAGNRPIHGWRDLMTQAEYVAQVVEGERALRALPYIEFAALFTAGPESPWWSYENDEDTVAKIAQGVAALPTTQTIRVWRRDTGAVEVVAVEQYLRGVVPAEMPASWPAQALAAQAVAARTYAVAAIAHPRHADKGADICDRPDCQAHSAAHYASTDAAVAATAGETWPGTDGSYVAECGRADCPRCNGASGTNGSHFPGRLCQWGAKTMADAGSTYHNILAHYYGGAQEVPVADKYPALSAYTWDGQPTTVAALQAVYGFDIRRATVAPGAEVIRLVAIREKYGDSAQIAKVTRLGVPEVGINVAWHWPDAAVQNIPNQWNAHYELAQTNANGEVGPGMGMGAYHAVGSPGPHAMWVVSQSTKSDAVFGLGMITMTDHHHVDLAFDITVQEAELVPTPTAPPTNTSLLETLRNAGWNAAGVALNPDAALTRYAQVHGFGAPLGNEVTVAGYVVQPFRDCILYVAEGDWGNVKTLDY